MFRPCQPDFAVIRVAIAPSALPDGGAAEMKREEKEQLPAEEGEVGGARLPGPTGFWQGGLHQRPPMAASTLSFNAF
jgi:hypothetical protein